MSRKVKVVFTEECRYEVEFTAPEGTEVDDENWFEVMEKVTDGEWIKSAIVTERVLESLD